MGAANGGEYPKLRNTGLEEKNNDRQQWKSLGDEARTNQNWPKLAEERNSSGVSIVAIDIQQYVHIR